MEFELITALVWLTVGELTALANGAIIKLLSIARVTATPNILEYLLFIDF